MLPSFLMFTDCLNFWKQECIRLAGEEAYSRLQSITAGNLEDIQQIDQDYWFELSIIEYEYQNKLKKYSWVKEGF